MLSKSAMRYVGNGMNVFGKHGIYPLLLAPSTILEQWVFYQKDLLF